MHLSKNIASLSVLLICTVAGNPISFTENNEVRKRYTTFRSEEIYRVGLVVWQWVGLT